MSRVEGISTETGGLGGTSRTVETNRI